MISLYRTGKRDISAAPGPLAQGEPAGPRRSGLRRFFLGCTWTAALLAAAVVLVLFYCFFAVPGKGIQELTDWQYTSGDQLRYLTTEAGEWRTADREHPLSAQGGDTYYWLRGTLSSDGGDTLLVRTVNSSLQITVDGELIYDGLKGKEMTGDQLRRFQLKNPEREQTVEIVLYSPLAFGFFAYQAQGDSLYSEGFAFFYGDLILGGMALLVGVFCLWQTHRIRQKKWKGIAYTLPVIWVLWGCLAGLDRLPLILPDLPASFPFHAELMLWVVIFWLLPFSLLLGRVPWSTPLEVLTAVNILYACCMLFWPYDVFLTYLIGAGLVLQVANIAGFVVLLRKSQRPLSLALCAGMALFFFADIAYWFSLTTHGSAVTVIFLQAVVLLTGILCWADSSSYAVALQESRGEKITDCPLPEGGYGAILSATVEKLIEEKCDGPERHLYHVAEYTQALCGSLEIHPRRTQMIAAAAMLHDIGKVAIPREILLKNEKLTEQEYKEIRQHHLYGFRMLDGSQEPFMKLAARIALEHHEHLDGSGYLGLRGEEISLEARIVAVADVFDALTSPREYKRAWSFEQACSYIEEHSGVYYDSEVVRAFRRAKPRLLELYWEDRQNAAEKDDRSGGNVAWIS